VVKSSFLVSFGALGISQPPVQLGPNRRAADLGLLVPRPAVEQPACLLLVHPTPLLEEERHVLTLARVRNHAGSDLYIDDL